MKLQVTSLRKSLALLESAFFCVHFWDKFMEFLGQRFPTC